MPLRRRVLTAIALTLGVLGGSSCGLNDKGPGDRVVSDSGFFKGTIECVANGCHADSISTWAAGFHANGNAVPDSATGRDPACQKCHDPVEDLADAADLFPLIGGPARPVSGCEGCHGTASGHYAYTDSLLTVGSHDHGGFLVSPGHRAPLLSTVSPMFPDPRVSASCLCHSPDHHAGGGSLSNQQPEWWGGDGPARFSRDGHSDSLLVHTKQGHMTSAQGGIPCAACHTVEGFLRVRLGGETLSQQEIDRIIALSGDTDLPTPSTIPGEDALPQVNCVTCHPSHQPGVLTRLPAGSLCQECHAGLATVGDPGVVPYRPQAEMLEGTGGYEFAGFSWAATLHSAPGDTRGCVGCHLLTFAGAAGETVEDLPLKLTTGHRFRPRVERCMGDAPCHAAGTFAYASTSPAAYAFSTVPALADLDRDGDIEGFKTEVRGMLEELKGRLEDRGVPWDNPEQIFDLPRMAAFDATVRGAAYNYDLVVNDRSLGFHSPLYAADLLAASLSVLR